MGAGLQLLRASSGYFISLGLKVLRCVDEDKSFIHLFIYHTYICFNIYAHTVFMAYNYSTSIVCRSLGQAEGGIKI